VHRLTGSFTLRDELRTLRRRQVTAYQVLVDLGQKAAEAKSKSVL
jgi:hypothetical protein